MPSAGDPVPRPAPTAPGPGASVLWPLVYDELRRIARRLIGREAPGATLTPTALVHEVYLKLARMDGWSDRQHVQAVAARAMRQILVDRARARHAAKRGGSPVTLPAALDLTPDLLAGDEAAERVLSVESALDLLGQHDPALAHLVELRFFGDLGLDEAAAVLGVSPRTAARLWARAKAHLHSLLT